MTERLFAVRGATQVEKDDRSLIIESVTELYDALCAGNGLREDHMVSIQFTVTTDLHTVNPATALRSRDVSCSVPLFCMQEPVIDGMLPRTIRMLVHYYQSDVHRPQAVYLHGARMLRPDLVNGEL